MLTWNTLDILSCGAGTPSTALALMSCQNAQRGPPYPFPKVPVYDAVIFCDLHSEPGWVYEQAAFTAAACREAGIPFYCLDADLYGDFTRNFGRARTACIPFWTLGDDGKKGKMPRQCTYDYKIKVIEKFVRYELLRYKPRERTLPLDVHAHSLHMGIMWEERRRAKESKQTLFVNRYPLVEMGWTRKYVVIWRTESTRKPRPFWKSCATMLSRPTGLISAWKPDCCPLSPRSGQAGRGRRNWLPF